jgi:ribosome modulation factor
MWVVRAPMEFMLFMGVSNMIEHCPKCGGHTFYLESHVGTFDDIIVSVLCADCGCTFDEFEKNLDFDVGETSLIFDVGIEARKKHIDVTGCPYKDFERRQEWIAGWCDQDMIEMQEMMV